MSNLLRTSYLVEQSRCDIMPGTAKKALPYLELLFSSILEGMQDSIVVLNRSFEILYANGNFGREVGYSLEHMKGRSCYEVTYHRTSPCYLTGSQCVVKQTFESGCSSRMIDLRESSAREPRYYEISAYPVKDRSGHLVSVAKKITDITEQNRLEEELRGRVKDLEEFYHMAVSRETKMLELKEEIKRLKKELVAYKIRKR